MPEPALGEPAPLADTSYACTVDAAGNAFSTTPSDGSSATPVIPGTGLCPSSRGSQSSAVEAPRFATYSFPSSSEPHAYHPGRLNLESRIDRSTVDQLASLGHKVAPWAEIEWRAGAVCAIRVHPETGLLEGGADPRRPCYALGV